MRGIYWLPPQVLLTVPELGSRHSLSCCFEFTLEKNACARVITTNLFNICQVITPRANPVTNKQLYPTPKENSTLIFLYRIPHLRFFADASLLH